jgi:hypothetical protein
MSNYKKAKPDVSKQPENPYNLRDRPGQKTNTNMADPKDAPNTKMNEDSFKAEGTETAGEQKILKLLSVMNEQNKANIEKVHTEINELKNDFTTFDKNFSQWKTGVDTDIVKLKSEVATIDIDELAKIDIEKLAQIDLQELVESCESAVQAAFDAEKMAEYNRKRIAELEEIVEVYSEKIEAGINKNAFLIKALQRQRRERNVRAGGITQMVGESCIQSAHRILVEVITDLKITDIVRAEKVIPRKIPEKKERVVENEGDGEGETSSDEQKDEIPLGLALGQVPKPWIPNLIIEFTTKEIRDRVFTLGRKHKKNFSVKISIREDMIKADWDRYKLARPVMDKHHEDDASVKTNFTYGDMIINSKKTAIPGEEKLRRCNLPPTSLNRPDLRKREWEKFKSNIKHK